MPYKVIGGKPTHVKYSSDEVFARIKHEEIKFIDLQFTSLPGRFHHTTISADTFTPDQMEDGLPKLDGSSIVGFTSIDDSDLILKPDPNSYAIIPWIGDLKSARMLCDIYRGAGRGRLDTDPRGICQKAEEYLKTKGFDESDVFKFIEDYELWLRIAKLGIIRILSEPLVKYRIYNKKNRDETDVMIRVLKIFDKHQELGLLSTQNSMKARGNQYVCIGRAFQNIGNFKGIIYYIKGLYYSYRLKNKLRAIAGLFLFFVPKFLRIFLERIAYRMYHFFY